MNEDLDMGSVFPFVKRAEKDGYSVIIYNPNKHFDEDTKESIPGSETMSIHCLNVWQTIMRMCEARDIYIIAHSAGGPCVSDIMRTNRRLLYQYKYKVCSSKVHGDGQSYSPH